MENETVSVYGSAEEAEAHGCLGRQFLVSGNFAMVFDLQFNFSRGLEE